MIKSLSQTKIDCFLILGISFVFVFTFCTYGFAQNPDPEIIFKKYKKAKQEFEKFEEQHGHFLQTQNTKMHYLTWGNPEDLPIIWIHGSFTNAYEIKDVAEKIVSDGNYLIAVDYYGHGLTPIPDHDVSLYHVADDILELMNRENIEKAVIAGWSRGGYIATAFYDSYPERVLGLILEDGGTVATNTYYHSLEENQLVELVDNLFKDRIEYLKFETEFEVYEAYHDSSDPSTQFELLAWITQNKQGLWTIGPGIEELFHMSNRSEFLQNILRPTKSPLFAKSMALMEPYIIYRNLQVPLLILDPTSNDDIFPFEAENGKLKLLHPNLISHHIYENTGHNIHYEKQERFVEDVLSFLNTLR